MRSRLVAASVTWLVVACTLVGCTALPVDEDPSAVERSIAGSGWAEASDLRSLGPTPGWRHQRYGQQRPTRYAAAEHAGRPALHASSLGGNSTLRLPLRAPADPQQRLRFSWFVPQLNLKADLRDAQIDDAVVRVILSFDGDHSAWRPRDHMLSELARLVTGEPMPDATLMYVWDHRYPVGTVLSNPHTARIRMIVVQSGTGGLNRWHDIERDIAADYRLAFGAEPGLLTGVGLMSDSNNTGEAVQAWFGPMFMEGAGTADAAYPVAER